MKKYRLFIALTLLTFIAPGCNKKKDAHPELKGNYFSIRQFALDEWNTYCGEPFLLEKIVRVNNNTIDSGYTSSDTLNWGVIFKIFFETDISDRKFLDLYKFSQFDDDADNTHNFYYEATDEDVYTRKLLITIDQFTNRVKGIYVEAIKNDMFDETTYKLYYKPMQRIQIQRIEKPTFGDKKHTVTEYEFKR